MTSTPSHYHTVPIRLHQIEDGLVLAAPMPGLEPSDITVVIISDTVRLLGKFRGARLPHEDLLMGEWTSGPYYREVVLPQRVNGALTQATYGHGVLVLAMPTLAPGTLGSYTAFELEHMTATWGQRVRPTGRALPRFTTPEAEQSMEQRAPHAPE
jgi:HSP20 family protein